MYVQITILQNAWHLQLKLILNATAKRLWTRLISSRNNIENSKKPNLPLKIRRNKDIKITVNTENPENTKINDSLGKSNQILTDEFWSGSTQISPALPNIY